jgi:hypothetical protein
VTAAQLPRLEHGIRRHEAAPGETAVAPGKEEKTFLGAAMFPSGLPDGLFSNQKSQIWVSFGGPLNGK